MKIKKNLVAATAAVLAAGDRRRAPGTAPAQGLCLHAVEYGAPGLGDKPAEPAEPCA